MFFLREQIFPNSDMVLWRFVSVTLGRCQCLDCIAQNGRVMRRSWLSRGNIWQFDWSYLEISRKTSMRVAGARVEIQAQDFSSTSPESYLRFCAVVTLLY
jgi:hypothetical protein